MPPSVFMSHTKLDQDFCDRFDRAVARVGIRAFRSEFETITPPAWKTIKEQIEESCAAFLLVGKQLVRSQAMSDLSTEGREQWKHTQNWIAYEIGLACERGIDVWVVCDWVDINFPVPYLNNYALGLGTRDNEIGFMRRVLEEYLKGNSFPLGYDDRDANCPYTECGAQFNLHSAVPAGREATCPTCLRRMVSPKDGWLMSRSEVSIQTM